MKPFTIISILLVVFGCASSHSICGLNRENHRDPIVGLWSTQNDDMRVEFLSNGGVVIQDTMNSRWEYLPEREFNLIILDDKEIYYSIEPGDPEKKSWKGKVIKGGRVYNYFPDCTRTSFKKTIYVKGKLLVVDDGNYQDKYKKLE